MKKTILFLSLFLVFGMQASLHSQDLNIDLSNKTVGVGDTVDVAITTSQFLDMVSVQFSINWNTSVIQFLNSDEMDLGYVAVGSTDSANGNLRISWFDVEGIGETVDDGSGIVNLKFLTVGEIGDYTDVSVTGTPLEIQIYQDTGADTIFQPIGLEINQGSVTIGESTGGGSGSEISVAANINNVDCNGDENGAIDIALEGDSNYTFQWSGPEGFTSTNPDIENLAGGDYELTVFDVDGIVVLDSVFSVVQPLQALMVENIQTDTTDCNKTNGGAIVNMLGGTPPYSYDIGFGAVSQNMMAGLASGSYSLTVTDNNDCSLTTSFMIVSATAQSFDLGENLEICKGEEVFLESPMEGTYNWSTGDTEPSISVSTPGTYGLTITDQFDCISFDTIVVAVVSDINLQIENDTLGICPGDSIQLLVTGGAEYEWLTGTESLNAVTVPDPIATPAESTIYSLVGSSECGIDTIDIEVNVFEVTASAGQDTCIAAGEELRLNASGGLYYYWIGGDYPLSDYDIPNPTTTPEDSTTYSIMIVDENGCATFDEVTVLVGSNPLQFLKHINVITPNGDRNNDVLYFNGIQKYGPNTLKIFNRWGDIVYDRINYQYDDERFDGTFKGEDLPAGTYYYVLSFREESLKQTLTIIRD